MSDNPVGMMAHVATPGAGHANAPSLGADMAQLMQSEAGANILLGRLKQSIKSAQDFAQYVKQRAVAEEGYAQALQNLNHGPRNSVFSFWRTGQRISLDASSSTPGLQVVRDLSGAGMFYAAILQKLASETRASIIQFEKEWKSWNQTMSANTKRLRALELEAENAKSQHRHLEENFVKAKNGQNGTLFGLVPGKGLDPHEESQYRLRIQAASDELILRSESFRLERRNSIDAQTERVSIAVGGLILECDRFLNSQLEKYTTLYSTATQTYQSCLTPQASQQQQSGLLMQKPVARANPLSGGIPNAGGTSISQNMPRSQIEDSQTNGQTRANPQVRQQPPTQHSRTQRPPVQATSQQPPSTQQPPMQRAPMQQPITQQAPAQQPPSTQQAPAQRPPMQRAPMQQPPMQQAPAQQTPSTQQPQVQRPPMQRPPVQRPTTQQAPVQQPPSTRQPPVQRPPMQRPPMQKSPMQQSPMQRPQMQKPLAQPMPQQQRPNAPGIRQPGPSTPRPPLQAQSEHVGQKLPVPSQLGTVQARPPQLQSQPRAGPGPARPSGPSQNGPPQPTSAQNRPGRPGDPQQPQRMPPKAVQIRTGEPGTASTQIVQGSAPQPQLSRNGPPTQRSGPPQTRAAENEAIQRPVNRQNQPVHTQPRPASARPSTTVSGLVARPVSSLSQRQRQSSDLTRSPTRSGLHDTSLMNAAEAITPAAQSYHAHMYPDHRKEAHPTKPSVHNAALNLAHAQPPIAWLPPPNPVWPHAAPLTPPYPMYARPYLSQTMHSPSPPPAAYSLSSSMYPAAGYAAAYAAPAPAQPQYYLPHSPYMTPSSHIPPYPISGQSAPLEGTHPQLVLGQYTMNPHDALRPTVQYMPGVAAEINSTVVPPRSSPTPLFPAHADATSAGKAYQKTPTPSSHAGKTLPNEHAQNAHAQNAIIKEAAGPIHTVESSFQSKSSRSQDSQAPAKPISASIDLDHKSTTQRTTNQTNDQQRAPTSAAPKVRAETVSQHRSLPQPSQRSRPRQLDTHEQGAVENSSLSRPVDSSQQASIRKQTQIVQEARSSPIGVQDAKSNATQAIPPRNPQQSFHKPAQASDNHLTPHVSKETNQNSAEKVPQADQDHVHTQIPDQALALGRAQQDHEKATQGLSQQPHQHAHGLPELEASENTNLKTAQSAIADKAQSIPDRSSSQVSQRALDERPSGRTGAITQGGSSKLSETHQISLKEAPRGSGSITVEAPRAISSSLSHGVETADMPGDQVLGVDPVPDKSSKVPIQAVPIPPSENADPENADTDKNRHVFTHVLPSKPPEDHDRGSNMRQVRADDENVHTE